MKKPVILIAALAVYGAVSPFSEAAPDTVDTAFSATAGRTYRDSVEDYGSVASILVQPDGRILVGSNEMPTTLGAPNNLRSPLIRFNPDGSVDNRFFADDQATGEGTGIVFTGAGWPEVMALGLQSDRKIIAGGVMTGMVDDTNNILSRNIVRILPDGRVDPTFQTAGTQQWITGNINYISHLFTEPDDKVVIAGGFRGVRNSNSDPFTTRHGIARLHADGSLDTSFELIPEDFGVPVGASGVRAIFYQAERDTAGNYYLTGEIIWNGGQTHVFARLFPNGRRDLSFLPLLSAARWNSVAIDRQGRITVTGLVDSNPTVMHRVFPDGAVDPSFSLGAGLGPFMAQPLEIDSAGRSYFSSGGQLRRVNSDGSLDATFTGAAAWAAWAITPSWNTATTAPDGRIYAGGFFNRVNGEAPVKLVRFEGDPVADGLVPDATSVSVVENSGSLFFGVTRVGSGAGVASLDFASVNGTALAGIDFTSASGTLTWADGETGRRYVTIPLIDNAHSDGVKGFSLQFSNAAGAPVSGAAAAVSILDDEAVAEIIDHPGGGTVFSGVDRTLRVRIRSATPSSFQWQFDDGSGFTNIPGATGISYTILKATAGASDGIYRVVVTNAGGSVPSAGAVITVAEPAGTLDPEFLVNISGVDAIRLGDGRMLVVGSFTQFNGVTLPVPNIVRLSADGTFDPTWTPTGAGANGEIRYVSAFPEGSPHAGKLVVAGSFTTYNGATVPRLARLNADGSFDNTWVPSLTVTNFDFAVGVEAMADGAVLVGYSTAGLRRYNADGLPGAGFAGQTGFLNGFAVQPDGRVVSRFNTTGPTRGYLRRHLATGELDPDFSPPGAFSSALLSLAFGPGGEIYATGSFFTLSDLPASRVVRLFPNGQRDPGFSFESEQAIGSVLVMADGSLLLKSTAANVVNGVNVQALIRVLPDGSIDPTFFAAENVSALFLDAVGRIHGFGPGGLRRMFADFGVFQFGAPEFVVTESTGPINVQVLRLLGSRGPVSVAWEVDGGTAVHGVDFTGARSGVLEWADGENAAKNIPFTLLDDTAAEDDKTIVLRLFNPTDLSRLGAVPGAQILILDTDSAPRVIAHPLPVTRAENLPATFKVVAQSPYPISYQWFFEGAPIPDAVAATFTIPNVTFANAGRYSVRVGNQKDSNFSNEAKLTILPSPTAVDPAWTAAAALTGTGVRTVNAITPLGDGRAFVGGTFAAPGSKIALLRADGSLDPSFTVGAGTTVAHTINAITVQPDGKVIIGGDFTQFGGQSVTNLIRLNADYSIDQDFITLLGGAPNNPVLCIALQGDGKILVGGSFSQLGDHPTSNGLVRLNPDGSPDRSFMVPYGGSPDFRQIDVLPDGKILVAGGFVGYQGANRIVRLHADGSRDTAFNSTHANNVIRSFVRLPDGGLVIGGDFTTTARPRIARLNESGSFNNTFLSGVTVNGNVHSLALQENGRIVAGGAFTTFGIAANRFMRINPDGSLDGTLSLGSGFNNIVERVALDPNGTIWVGGSFFTYQDDGSKATRIVRLAGDGVPVAIGVQPVATKAVTGQGTMLAVNAVGFGDLTYQWFKGNPGQPVSDGSGISGSTTNTLTFAEYAENQAGNYYVRVGNGEGDVVLSETVNLGTLGAPVISAQPLSQSLPTNRRLLLTVAAKGAPTLDYSWTRNGQPVGGNQPFLIIANPTPSDSGSYQVMVGNSLDSVPSDVAEVTVVPAPVNHDAAFAKSSGAQGVVLPLSDGRLLLGGTFTFARNEANASISRSRLAVYDSAGGLTADDPAPNGTVLTMVELPDGSILVGGNFTQIHGVPANYLAKLKPDLSLDPSFSRYLGTIQPPASGTGGVDRILPLPDGRIFISGNFVGVDGAPGSMAMALLHPEGTLDTSFVSPQSGLFATTFRAGLVDELGRIILAPGNIFNLPTQSLYRFHLDGSLDQTFNPGLPASSVNAMARTPDGGIVTTGSIVRKISSAGTVDPTFGHNLAIFAASSPTTHAIALQADGKIVIGGSFTYFSGPGRNIVRLNPDGTPDPLFFSDPGFNQPVTALAVSADGRIFASGQFSSYRGETVNNLAVIGGDPVGLAWARKPLAEHVSPGGSLYLTGLATGTSALAYEWLLNGQELTDGARITGASTAQLSVADFGAQDPGIYTLRVTNGAGTIEASVPVDLLGNPVILTSPSGGVSFEGLPVILRATGTAADPLSWQWLLDGEPIDGANDFVLKIPVPTSANNGGYSVVLSGNGGAVESSVAEVRIIRDPAGIGPGFPLAAGVGGGNVNTILALPDGGVIVGGTFSQAGATGAFVARPRLARFAADGTLDPVFNPAPDQAVTALAAGHGGAVFVGGSFNQIGGGSHPFFAKLSSNGNVDADFMANVGSGPGAVVNVILPLADGRILVGGNFTSWSGQLHRGVVRLLANGSLDQEFASGLTGGFPSVNAIAMQGAQLLVAGSSLSNWNDYIIRLNHNGSRDAAFVPPALNFIHDIAVAADLGIYVAGQFSSVSGNTSFAGLIRLHPGGALDPTFSPGPVSGAVNRLALDPGGRLTAVGNFTSIGGSGRAPVRFLSDGSRDPLFNAGTGFSSGNISGLAIAETGEIWLGSPNTSTLNGQSGNGLFLLNGGPSVAVVGPTDPMEIWLAAAGVPVGLRAAGDDPDGDGVANLVEYLFGTNPNDASSRPAAHFGGEEQVSGAVIGGNADPAKDYSVIRVELPKDLLGINLAVEVSLDLVNFGAGTATAHEFGQRIDNGVTETRSYYLTPARDDASMLFWRLRLWR